MRKLIAFAVAAAVVPTAAQAGNSVQQVEPNAKTPCVKQPAPESRNQQRGQQRITCPTQKSVPWVVDPTPIFIL